MNKTFSQKRIQQPLEWTAFGLYFVLNIILTVFHEPWYDEAESWLIARDATIADIIFVRPHFEGHPPLWHLILAVPAKLGMPYEPSIKIVQLVFALVMVYLLIFRSPFARCVRLFIPFTYFFLYQYGIQARPYALFCVSMFLIAMNWKERDTKPWPVIFSMMLLCASSAYGIVFAGGMAVVWVGESLIGDPRSVLRNRSRTVGWAVLIVSAVFLIISIIPYQETAAVFNKELNKSHGFLWRFLFVWLVVPSETMITSCADYCLLQYQVLDAVSFVLVAFVSLLIWSMMIIVCGRRKKTRLLLVPYIFVSLFAAYTYLNVHHYGMILAFFLGILWICFSEKQIEYMSIREGVDSLFSGISTLLRRYIVITVRIVLVLLVGINLLWTVVSAVSEIRYNYGPGRDMARFITDNGLEDYRWFGAWDIIRDQDDPARILKVDTGAVNLNSVDVNPYLPKNLISNSPEGVSYVPHQSSTPEQTRDDIMRWKEDADPDFILALASDFPDVKDELGLESDYSTVTVTHSRRIWKADMFPNYPTYIYVRKELCDKLGLRGKRQ